MSIAPNKAVDLEITPDRQNLSCTGVTVDFQGIRAIDDVSLVVRPGEIFGLIGPNGAGKTTLVNVLTGFQQPTSGRVSMLGDTVTAWPAWRRSRAGLARTFQNALLFAGLSVVENIESGALAAGLDRRRARSKAMEVLEWLDLAHVAGQIAGTLPFGAERRAGIGRAIAANPKFLLMDEPAAGLNDAECNDLAILIRRIRGELGCGILLIEHRMSLVFGLCDRIQVLDRGRTIAVGTSELIQNDADVRRAYLGEPA
jgi:branched-chain amino acid transport system ATP-binding protein